MTQKDLLYSINEKVNALYLGMYGDEKNGMKGLVQRQDADEAAAAEIHQILKNHDERIKSNERFKRISLRAWGAFWGSITTGITLSYDKIINVLKVLFHV